MHKREEEHQAWRARQLDLHIAECERYIATQIELIAELKLHRANVAMYTERLSKFEAAHRLRIQELDLLINHSWRAPSGGDQIDILALKIAGLSALL